MISSICINCIFQKDHHRFIKLCQTAPQILVSRLHWEINIMIQKMLDDFIFCSSGAKKLSDKQTTVNPHLDGVMV